MKKPTHQLSRQVAVVFAVLCLFMAVGFARTFFINQPVDRASAEERTAVYSHYEEEYGPKLRRSINTVNYIELFFEGGENELIRGICANKDLYESLDCLEKGTTLHMLINPDNNYIIELRADEEEILNFDYAQKKLRQEGTGFLCLGIFMLVLCGYFVYTAITTKERITKEDIKFYWDIMRGK